MIKNNLDNKKNFQNNSATYGYYSKLLKEPFDTLTQLQEAEEAYNAKLKAKEAAAAAKKADACKVEAAFQCMNNARRQYKESMKVIVEGYTDQLKQLKVDFEKSKEEISNVLAKAEQNYADELKAFTDKYDTYHLSLKDGDFETTIASTSETIKKSDEQSAVDLLKLIFGI